MTITRLVVAIVLGLAISAMPTVAQEPSPDPDQIIYDAISGNAFHFFADTEGTGVEVVAFGPDEITESYGIVVRNFTPEPVYNVTVNGTIRGDDGETSVISGLKPLDPYAVPSGGLAIMWGSLMPDDEVGANPELDVEVAYDAMPQSDGAPRVAIPVAEVERDGDELTARVVNDLGFPLDTQLLSMVCFDAAGVVSGAYAATQDTDEAIALDIEPGDEATFTFELAEGDDCEWFLIAGTGLDETTGAVGTAPLPADAPAPGNLSLTGAPGTAGDGTTEQLVADCTPFATFEEAQAYYAEHPDAQPIIDPDLDGYACEVYFGVDPQGGSTDQPADSAPAQPDTGGGCDPSYPSLCIPIGSPDLDCGEVGARGFPVLPPDPHGFDNDGDGIGCEG